jgi:hypothetical protein
MKPVWASKWYWMGFAPFGAMLSWPALISSGSLGYGVLAFFSVTTWLGLLPFIGRARLSIGGWKPISAAILSYLYPFGLLRGSGVEGSDLVVGILSVGTLFLVIVLLVIFRRR